MHDFLMYGAVTIATFSSGSLLSNFGWQAVNLAVLPFLVVALMMIIILAVQRKRTRIIATAVLLSPNS